MDSKGSKSDGPRRPAEEVWLAAPTSPTYSYQAAGGVTLSGPQHYRADTDYQPRGGTLTGGQAAVLLGHYAYSGSGGVLVEGILFALDYCYEGSGGVEFGGAHPANAYNHVGSGSILTGGGSLESVPVRLYIPTGSITLGGFAADFHTDPEHTFFNFQSGGSQIVTGGQAGMESSAPPTYSHQGSGGIMGGGFSANSTTGIAEGRPVGIGSGGISTAGAGLTTVHPNPVALGTGGAVIAGTAISRVNFRYPGQGTFSVGGYGDTPAALMVSLDQWFNWNVIANQNIDFTFQWGYSNSVLYWWRVESCCEPTNSCDHFLLSDGGSCKKSFTIPILARTIKDVCQQLTDRGITSRICSIGKFSRAAYKPDQAVLQAQGIDQKCNVVVPVPYCDVPQCLNLCLDYNLNFNWDLGFGLSFQYVGSGGLATGGAGSGHLLYGGPRSLGGGGVVTGGAAPVQTSRYQVYMGSSSPGAGGASEGPQISGTALITIDHWLAQMAGGITVLGNDDLRVNSTVFQFAAGNPNSTYAPTGDNCFPEWLTSLTLTDMFGDVILSRQGDQFVGCRQMMLSSDDASNRPVSTPVRFVFSCGGIEPSFLFATPSDLPPVMWRLSIGYVSNYFGGAVSGYTCSSYDSAPLRSTDTNLGLPYLISYPLPASYPINVVFTAPCYTKYGCPGPPAQAYGKCYGTYYTHPGDVGVTIRQTIPTPTVSTGPRIRGNALTQRVYQSTSLGTSDSGPSFAGIRLDGAGVGVFHPALSAAPPKKRRFERSFESSALIKLGGFSDVDHFTNVVQMQAALHVDDALIPMGYSGTVNLSKVSLNQQDIIDNVDPSVLAIPISNTRVRTKCDCSLLGDIVQMRHNYASAGRLQEFLRRNRLDIPSTLPMSYNSDAWQSNLHLEGYAADGAATESWDAVFGWRCSAMLGGMDQGSPLWIYSALFNVRMGREHYTTRILMAFGPFGPCQESSTINFNFDANTTTGAVTTNPSHNAYSSLFQDSIGLFRSKQWMANPHLTISITEEAEPSSVGRVLFEFNPIFAET